MRACFARRRITGLGVARPRYIARTAEPPSDTRHRPLCALHASVTLCKHLTEPVAAPSSSNQFKVF